MAVDHGAGIGVKAVSPRRFRAPAGFPGDDRVRLADQSALHCNAELRPVAGATRLILSRQHIDKLVPVVPCGPFDARALDLQRVVLRALTARRGGDADASERALVCGRAASSLCCALSVFSNGALESGPRGVSNRSEFPGFHARCGRAGSTGPSAAPRPGLFEEERPIRRPFDVVVHAARDHCSAGFTPISSAISSHFQ